MTEIEYSNHLANMYQQTLYYITRNRLGTVNVNRENRFTYLYNVKDSGCRPFVNMELEIFNNLLGQNFQSTSHGNIVHQKHPSSTTS